MAKLGSYYGLCPLIDNKSLFGVCEDVTEGAVVVTLGKNIAIKYKLSDQKQMYSWRTKQKFSSPIIYDKSLSKYVSVFNQSYIRTWTGDEEHLDKLKKHIFNTQIQTIISTKTNSFIIFQNGSIYELCEALNNRKMLQPEDVIGSNNQIQDILCSSVNDTIYFGLIVKSASSLYLYWNCSKALKEFHKIQLERQSCRLLGYVFHVHSNKISLLTIWSDGRILSCELESSEQEETPGELFAVTDSLSTEQEITMISLDDNYIAMYGADANEEGAALIIYNTQFKVTQSKLAFKMFTSGAKLWRIQNNLFLPVGQNLAVVPFHLDKEQLAALVGSHKSVQADIADTDICILQEVEIADWNTETKLLKRNVPESLKNKLSQLAVQGLPERIIFEELLPDLFEKQNLKNLSLTLDYFRDISEKCLVKVLKFCLNVKPESFTDKQPVESSLFPEQLQPTERIKIIDQILAKPFSEVLLIPHLRTKLDLNEVLLLLKYICFQFSEDGHCFSNLSSTETKAKLIDWGCVLLDSNYQKILLTKDDQVDELVKMFNGLVHAELECLENLNQVVPILTELKKGNSLNKCINNSLKYSIEQLCLY